MGAASALAGYAAPTELNLEWGGQRQGFRTDGAGLRAEKAAIIAY
jgi:hypothetical protein